MDQTSSAGRGERSRPQMSRAQRFEANIRMPTEQELAAGHPLTSAGVSSSTVEYFTFKTTGACTPQTPLTPPTAFPSEPPTAPLTRMNSHGRTRELNRFEFKIYLKGLHKMVEAALQKVIRQEAGGVSDKKAKNDFIRMHVEYLHARLSEVRKEQIERMAREEARGKSRVWSNAVAGYEELKKLVQEIMQMIRRRSTDAPPRGRVYGRPTFPLGGDV